MVYTHITNKDATAKRNCNLHITASVNRRVKNKPRTSQLQRLHSHPILLIQFWKTRENRWKRWKILDLTRKLDFTWLENGNGTSEMFVPLMSRSCVMRWFSSILTRCWTPKHTHTLITYHRGRESCICFCNCQDLTHQHSKPRRSLDPH